MEEAKKELSTEELEQERQNICLQNGHKHFTRAVLKAEILQGDQRMLEITNILAKKRIEAIGTPKIVEAEVLPPEPEAQSIAQ